MAIDDAKARSIAKFMGPLKVEIIREALSTGALAEMEDDLLKFDTLKTAKQTCLDADNEKIWTDVVEKWGRLHVHNQALRDWRRLSMEQVSQSLTPKEAKRAYMDAPPDTEPRHLAMEKWRTLSKQQVEKATTFEQAQDAYFAAPPDSEVRALALNKWLSFCTTIELIRKAELVAPRYSDAELLILKRWNVLSLQQVGEASTVNEAIKAYENAYCDDSYAKHLAIRKIYELWK